jgi:hypothetical protein
MKCEPVRTDEVCPINYEEDNGNPSIRWIGICSSRFSIRKTNQKADSMPSYFHKLGFKII